MNETLLYKSSLMYYTCNYEYNSTCTLNDNSTRSFLFRAACVHVSAIILASFTSR